MSEKINNNVNEGSKWENKVPIEELRLPEEVYEPGRYVNEGYDNKLDKADDETEDATSLEFYEHEQDYKSSEIISQKAEDRINAYRRVIEKILGDEEPSREDYRKLGKDALDEVFGKAA